MCHAEYDAILSKGTPSVKGCTLYVTKYPCNMCAKLLVQSRIKEVVYVKEGETDITTDNGKKYEASRKILAAALPPKYTIYKCINIQTHKFYREKDPIEETVRKLIELMKKSGIDTKEVSLSPKYIIL